MQLESPGRIKAALATASSTLLGISTNSAAEWQVDSAVLLYSETDRVSVFEPVLNGRKEIGQDEFIDVRLVLDSLTGASANGAVPSDVAQTFTTPSGEGTYQINPGEIPLDPSFMDTRGAINVNWERPLDLRLKAIYGFNFSKEFDYLSLGVSASFTKDINNRNTSLSAALSVGSDLVNPIGGVPLGKSDIQLKQKVGTDDAKNIFDIMLGLTQVLDRRTLAQLNLSYGVTEGYLTDPYKIVSVVDDNSGADPGAVLGYIHESRPDKRTSQSLYTKLVHQLNRDVINVSYRYFWDDWGVKSHTIDLHYRYEINSTYFLQPHLRYYQQTAADFYRYFVTDSNLSYVSADYRLGEMITKTIGVSIGKVYSQMSELNVRIELLTQSGEGHPDEALGKLKQQNLFPDVTAYIIQVGYSLEF